MINYAGVVSGNLTPFQLAVVLDRVAIVKLILEHSPELANWADWRRRGELEKLKVFGIEVPNGTPLHDAAYFCRPEVAKLLLQYGADPNARDKHGNTPLHYAARRPCVAVVELLLDHGADPYAEGAFGRAPYDEASDPRVAYAFLRRGVSSLKLRRIIADYVCHSEPDAEYIDVLSPEDAAFCANRQLAAKALERNRYDIAVAVAAQAGDVAIVERILAERPELAPLAFKFAASLAVVEAAERRYKPSAEELQALLEEAVERGHAELVAYLLNRGLSADCQSLARAKDSKILEAVLSKGAPQCDKPFSRFDSAELLEVLARYYAPTPEELCEALASGKAAKAELLAKYVQAVDTKCVCMYFRPRIAAILVERGLLDPNAKCGNSTILHLAASSCDRGLTELLLSRGADASTVDAQGRTAPEVACRELLDLFI